MITVIIAGGSGTRLWPLSTPEYPKHLLKVTEERSLLQSTYDRARQLGEHVYVVSEVGHIHHVKEQLPELDDDAFIAEPARRNTASCVIAGLHHIQSRHDHDEPIAFIAADHYIRDVRGFVHTFKVAGEASKKYGREVLVGVEPTYPSTGLGYIQKDGLIDEDTFVFNVDSFTEKPDFETAQKFLQSGNYLWNCCYFVGSVNTFLQAMDDYSPEMRAEYDALLATTDEESYRAAYLEFENIAIDYALNEKVANLLVVPASFDWMDIGSFGDLHGVVLRDDSGNHVTGNIETEEVENSFIQNHEDKPVAVIGLDNVVVVNTPNGLIVARKDLAQKVGDVSKRFHK
jgi:mannose-1-phosphate guanylyltransferase